MKSIVVHEDGTELSYLDSGSPSSPNPIYTTIFAVHGIVFSSRSSVMLYLFSADSFLPPAIFQKVSAICCSAGIRFVAISRRGYKGSTPLCDTDKVILLEGTDTQKTDWLKSRGLEISNFMNAFMIREDLPASTPEGQGGCVLLGWSLGCSFTLSVITHIDALPIQVQARLASQLRAHILHGQPVSNLLRLAANLLHFKLEPPSHGLGLSPAPAHMPGVSDNSTISDEKKTRILMNWISSYFEDSGLLTRDPMGLGTVPSITRVPSMSNMTMAEAEDIMDIDQYLTSDVPFLRSCQHQKHVNYKAVLFDRAVRDRLPRMNNWLFIGDASSSYCISVLWSVQDDDEAYGGGNVNYKVLPGMNHFVSFRSHRFTVYKAYLSPGSGALGRARTDRGCLPGNLVIACIPCRNDLQILFLAHMSQQGV